MVAGAESAPVWAALRGAAPSARLYRSLRARNQHFSQAAQSLDFVISPDILYIADQHLFIDKIQFNVNKLLPMTR